MTRDRDGQAARKATQLVRTVDGTLGTHRFSMTDILLPLASVTVYTAPTGPVRLFDGFGAAVAGTAVAGAAAGCDWAVATGAEVLAMPPQALTPGNSQRK